MLRISGHYSDIHISVGGPVGGHGAGQSFTDDDGHYTDIHDIPAHRPRSFTYEHYVDIDRINGDHPGSADQASRSQGYEGLDQSALATLGQSRIPQDYARLGAEEAGASTQQTTEEIEMTAIGDQQNTVSLGPVRACAN